MKALQLAASLFLLTGAALLFEALPASAAVGTLTLSPSTGVTNGTVLTVTGSGFSHSSIGNILQCNSDPNQPTVALGPPISTSVSVGCTPPTYAKLVTTSATGTISTTWTVAGPTVGPPCGPAPDIATCPATDSAGNSPAADAALYPCPPTPAQQAAGDVCQLNYGDSANDSATANIGFPTATTTTTAASTTTTGATTTTTGATTTTTGATTTTTSATTTTTSGTGTGLTGPYELYCPGSPVGNIALNDATTSAALSPASPTSGQQFNVTGYQTSVNLPASLASAAAAIAPTLSGTANTQLDATGATPATMPLQGLAINITYPNPIPSSGVPLNVPSSPASEGPFTATSSSITIQEDSSANITLMVSGAPLSLTCTAYPNDTITPSGITTSTPSASPIAPVIATAGSGTTTTTTTPTTTTTVPPTTTTTSGSTTTTSSSGVTTTTTPSGSTTTSAPSGSTTTTRGGSTTTTASHSTTTSPPSSPSGGGGGGNTARPVTASASSLAFTGPGPGVAWLVLIGAGLVVLGFALFLLVDAPRRALAYVTTLRPNRLGGARLVRTVRTARTARAFHVARPTLPSLRVPRLRMPSPPSVASVAGGSRLGALGALRERLKMAMARVKTSASKLATSTASLAGDAARLSVRAATWLLGR